MKTLIRKQNLWLSLLFAGFTFLAPNTTLFGATVSSVASGDWNDNATWSGTAPGAGDTVHILSGHTVTVTANASVSQVTVNAVSASTELIINPAVKLTVTDWAFVNSAEGIEISKITVHGELESQGTIEFNADQFSILSRIVIDNVSGKLTVKGTFTGNNTKGIVDARKGTVELSSTAAQNVPSLYYGYTNLVIAGSSVKTLAANISAKGNLVINTSNTLDVSASNYSIDVGGNWVNNGGTFNKRAGTVRFNGTSAQAITSNGESFYNVVFNNTSSGVSLNDNVTITNACTLTDGVVSTGANTLSLESTVAANLSGHSNQSFINGNLRRYLASNTSTYSFPVGNGTNTTNYFRADIANRNMTGLTYIDASFEALSNHNDGDMSVADSWIDYTSVHTAGMWNLTPDGQPSGGSYEVALYTENFSGLTDNSFAPIKRADGGSGSDWTAGGTLSGDGGIGRMVAHGHGLRLNLSSFSEFGIGTGTPTGNALPIELLSFDAEKNGENVKLNWTTATEINNAYFEIEKSLDGENFKSIAKIEGAGNSIETLDYQHIDTRAANGVNYYKLKQTDYDGTYTYSNIVSVKFSKETVKGNVVIYPNPVHSGTAINIDVPSEIKDITSVEIYSAGSGKLVFNQQLTGNKHKLDIPADFSSGLYLVRISSGEWQENQKLLIQ